MPKPLEPSQMDPVNGQITWPSALQQDSFAAQRGEVDQIVRHAGTATAAWTTPTK